jgi:hypothetical protein
MVLMWPLRPPQAAHRRRVTWVRRRSLRPPGEQSGEMALAFEPSIYVPPRAKI